MRRQVGCGRSIVVLALACVVAFAARPAPLRAQDEMTMSATRPTTRPGAGAEGPLVRRAREIVSSLNLSDEQKQKVDAILRKAADESREMMGAMEDMAPPERMERMRERFGEVREQVAAVLNDEQKKAFREKLEAARKEIATAGAAAPPPVRRPGQAIERLRESLAKLDLSEEQKKKIDAVVEETRAQAKELREALMAGDEMAREKLGMAVRDAREEIATALKPDQREKLREMMESEMGPPMGPGMMESDRARGRRRDAARPATRPAAVVVETLKPGTRAPDFSLQRLDGQMVRLTGFEGRTTVIVFGSYSSPSFRQRAAGLEQLKREFGNRATFLVVYTKEAHPKGEWDVERNRDEEIDVEQHKDLKAREAMAEKAKSALKLTVPILVDSMDDAAASAYGLAPNGAVVIGKDLKVVARQQWFDPYTLRRHIEAATKPATRPGTPAARTE